ncbi:MAG: conjugal transfer protein TraE, partial [Abditibacteriota bacterium]|nr:conjugal transfer protein TraE [Abditibacteriota bacterium]
MKQKQQKAQEKRLRGALDFLRREKRDLRGMEAVEKPPPIHLTPDRKLNRTEKRRLTAAFKKAWKDGKVPRTAQQTIPYQEMCRDGICVVNAHYFSKQIQFYDINYQLARNDDKTNIFESYCEFLNYFDSSIHAQLSFLDEWADMDEYRNIIHIEEAPDRFNGVRGEFTGVLEGQMEKGKNGLARTKYITYGIEAENLKEAKPRLERIEADILANFKALGVQAHSMTGYERLEVLYKMFHPHGDRKFR